MIGPHARRVTPAAPENTAARMPENVAPMPRWSRYTDVPELSPWPTTKQHSVMMTMNTNSGVQSFSDVPRTPFRARTLSADGCPLVS